MAKGYMYEKYDEDYNVRYCPLNDYDGSVTGKIVIGVEAWFDENPEERKRLGWVKHILHSRKEVDYDSQTQYVIPIVNKIDDYTIEDEFKVIDKSEEMLLLEEMLEVVYGTADPINTSFFFGNGV